MSELRLIVLSPCSQIIFNSFYIFHSYYFHPLGPCQQEITHVFCKICYLGCRFGAGHWYFVLERLQDPALFIPKTKQYANALPGCVRRRSWSESVTWWETFLQVLVKVSASVQTNLQSSQRTPSTRELPTHYLPETPAHERDIPGLYLLPLWDSLTASGWLSKNCCLLFFILKII